MPDVWFDIEWFDPNVGVRVAKENITLAEAKKWLDLWNGKYQCRLVKVTQTRESVDMAKLIAESGVVNAISEIKIGPISIRMTRAAINPDSSLGNIKLYDEDGSAIYMTFEQAKALAHEILRRV